MKFRSGFVSNSSSSSFICGIAQINDKAKFDAYIEKHGIDLNDYDVFVTTSASDKWDVRKEDNKMVVESFLVTASAEINKPGTMFFVANISNDEGDGSFWNDDSCEMNYDIDIEYFSEGQQAVYGAFHDPNSGLSMENSDVSFGAARNG